MLLKIGTMSREVAHLQHALNLATTFAPKLNINGIFGPKTNARTRQFQDSKALLGDGIAGPMTLDALFMGVTLEANILVRPKSSGGDGRLPRAPRRHDVAPFVIDPRDMEWHQQVRAWREWASRPFPTGPAPPLPTTAPPSLTQPSTQPSVPLLPQVPVVMAPVQPGSDAKLSVPFATGANIETSVETGYWDPEVPDRFRLTSQEFNLRADFARIRRAGVTMEFEPEFRFSEIKDALEIDVHVKVTPLEIFGAGSTAADVEPLLISSLTSSWDPKQFGGDKAVAAFRPFARGFEIEVGGRFGPKFKLSHDGNGAATVSAYPLAGVATAGMRFKF